MIDKIIASKIVEKYCPDVNLEFTDGSDGLYLKNSNTICIGIEWNIMGLVHEMTHAIVENLDGFEHPPHGHDGVFADMFTKLAYEVMNDQLNEKLGRNNEISKWKVEKKISEQTFLEDQFEKSKIEVVSKLPDILKECDDEIKELIIELNKLDGIYTVESCFGHGKDPCQIWFKVKNFESLNSFAFYFLDCSRQWKILYDLGDVHRFNHKKFCLESTSSDLNIVKIYVDSLVKRLKEEL